MGTLVSKIPDLLAQRQWGAMDLIRRGLSVATSYKIVRGDISFTLDTVRVLCDIFEVRSLDELFEYRKDGEQ